MRTHQMVDASILTVARARDELAEDLSLNRTILKEERARFDAERELWEQERQRFNARIAELEATLERERETARRGYAALEARMHEEREAADRRYVDLLEQVRNLRVNAEQAQGEQH